MPATMDPNMRKMLEQKASFAGVSEAHYREFFARVAEKVASGSFKNGVAWENWLIGRIVWDRFFCKEPFPYREPTKQNGPAHAFAKPGTARLPAPTLSAQAEVHSDSWQVGVPPCLPAPPVQSTGISHPNAPVHGQNDQYVSLERHMELKAMAMGKRHEFFSSLQRARDEANAMFSDCSRYFRQWYAQGKVWDQWFTNEQFPGKKPLPYELTWDHGRRATAVAALAEYNLIYRSHQPFQTTFDVSKEPDNSLAVEVPKSSVHVRASSTAPTGSMVQRQCTAEFTKSTATPSTLAAPRKPLSQGPTNNSRLPQSYFDTPPHGSIPQQGNICRPESNKDKQPPRAKDLRATSYARRIRNFPFAQGWGDRHIPTSKDQDYGRLSYDDEPHLSSPGSSPERTSKENGMTRPTPKKPLETSRRSDDIRPSFLSTSGLEKDPTTKEQPKTADQYQPEERCIAIDNNQIINIANVMVNGKTFSCTTSAVENMVKVFIDDTSGSWVASCLNCQFVRQHTLGGNVILYAVPFTQGDLVVTRLADKFLENWVYQAVKVHPAGRIMNILDYWKLVQGEKASACEQISKSVSNNDENIEEGDKPGLPPNRGQSGSPSFLDDLDQLLAEEAAKVEGDSRIILDEETGEVITFGEYKVRLHSRISEPAAARMNTGVAGRKRAAPDGGSTSGDGVDGSLEKHAGENGGSGTSSADAKRTCIRPDE
ncbi:hypothetical protein PVAG01_04331 [Phlyctema vagabunda]|uniref:Uncharacterized protein n=1 Tax=Phlyctema vagabunda TaxID=108571 RepID=A0ABR4PNV2_9HELO